MSWLVAASAIILIAAIAGAVRYARRQPPSIEPISDPELRTDPRVKQFRMTGSNRLIEPNSADADLSPQTQAKLEEADLKSDLAMLETFLEDVRDSLGADEAVFWRWSEHRDTLTPAAWSSPNTPRPQHFDMQNWGGLVKWAAEGRVMHFDADARVAVTRLAAAPIEHDGRLIGVLSVARTGGLDRGREHLKSWLPRHAAQVGRLVSLFELRREYGRHMRQSHALLAATQRIQGHKSQEALSKSICDTAVEVSSATDAALIRWRPDVGRGWVQYTTAGFKHRAPFPVTAESLTANACEEGTLLVIEDVSKMTGPQSLFFTDDAGWPRGTLAIVP